MPIKPITKDVEQEDPDVVQNLNLGDLDRHVKIIQRDIAAEFGIPDMNAFQAYDVEAYLDNWIGKQGWKLEPGNTFFVGLKQVGENRQAVYSFVFILTKK